MKIAATAFIVVFWFTMVWLDLCPMLRSAQRPLDVRGFGPTHRLDWRTCLAWDGGVTAGAALLLWWLW